MKTCISCGIEFEKGDGDYCCKYHRLREYRKTPEGKAKRAEQQRRYLEKYPAKKADRLETLKNWNAYQADAAFDRLVNPRCEIDNTHCTPDDAGRGKCGDLAEGCIWNSHRQITEQPNTSLHTISNRIKRKMSKATKLKISKTLRYKNTTFDE